MRQEAMYLVSGKVVADATSQTGIHPNFFL